MLKYLVVLLGEQATSFCSYDAKNNGGLMSTDTLHNAIRFAMMENLNIQFVYPDQILPQTHVDMINSIDHIDIVSSTNQDSELLEKAEVLVFNSFGDIDKTYLNQSKDVIIRTTIADFISNVQVVSDLLKSCKHVSVVFKDVENFDNNEEYAVALDEITNQVASLIIKGGEPQINLVTDRIYLDKMNNCNAGDESITIAADGNFYICPGFVGSENVGSLSNGVNIPNKQLLQLDHAPICRNCDAFQCRRCIWHNMRSTHEVSVPSKQQCVMAHIERNAARKLLGILSEHGSFMPEKEIKKLSYLDPFEELNEW